jgi:regulator of protease activity HflC (stomatin/prohibitin superfamily)
LLFFVVIAVPVLLVLIWIVLLETSVQIAPGNLGLVLVRGRTTSRVLTPGRHFLSPFRRSMVATYPSREITYLATQDPSATGTTSDIERADPPLLVRLGDRTACRMSFTVRFRIDQPQLPVVHDRFGPDGLWAVVRDESRRAVITELTDVSVTSEDLNAPRRPELEAKLSEAVHRTLAAVGIDMTFFSLVDTGLGESDEVVQAAVRARLEVAKREAERLAQAGGERADTLPDEVLRYRQFQIWRELIRRWDRRTPLPIGLPQGGMRAVPGSGQAEATDQGAGA